MQVSSALSGKKSKIEFEIGLGFDGKFQLKKPGYLIFIFLFAGASLFAQYPEIKELNHSDFLFRQALKDIELSYTLINSGRRTMPRINFFRYRLKKEETIFTVSARFNLPYETIATLNRLENQTDIKPGDMLLIPNMPGLFINEEPSTDIEIFMHSDREKQMQKSEKFKIKQASYIQTCRFILNGRFTPTERAFFLDSMFRFPLPKGKISSYYGMRKDPFTGKNSFHKGIDISVPPDTEVFASRKGTVKETGFNNIYGNYIIISHSSDCSTLYGHLSKIFVKSGIKVKSGEVIGTSGSTGLSTGPHLHFEVRINEIQDDPEKFLPPIRGK